MSIQALQSPVCECSGGVGTDQVRKHKANAGSCHWLIQMIRLKHACSVSSHVLPKRPRRNGRTSVQSSLWASRQEQAITFQVEFRAAEDLTILR